MVHSNRATNIILLSTKINSNQNISEENQAL